MKLLTKEFRLCMHPTGFLMPLLSVLVLVPGYPYGVSCFYVTLALYFICLTARENHDAAYTLTLPVSRRDAVNARILFCVCLEIFQLILMGLFILVKYAIGTQPNPAGLDAGLALIGEGLMIYAIFNMIFFPVYYRNIWKPGTAFILGSTAVFLWIVLEIIATYTAPFVQFKLDQPDPSFMDEKAKHGAGKFLLRCLVVQSLSVRQSFFRGTQIYTFISPEPSSGGR